MQKTGNATTCYCSKLIGALEAERAGVVDEKRESDIKWTALTMYTGTWPVGIADVTILD